jgi:tRNA(Glu) U13 pseudouridine synthase TruD
MTTFKTALEKKIEDSVYNNFGIENFDEQRFGKFKQSLKEKFKDKIKKIIRYKSKMISKAEIFRHEDELGYIWSKLNDKSQDLPRRDHCIQAFRL